MVKQSLGSFPRFRLMKRPATVVRTARSRAFKPEEISECLIYRLRRIGDVGERDGPGGMDNRTGDLSLSTYSYFSLI